MTLTGIAGAAGQEQQPRSQQRRGKSREPLVRTEKHLHGRVFYPTGSSGSGTSSASSLARSSTASSIGGVRTPVKVFCWDGW